MQKNKTGFEIKGFTRIINSFQGIRVGIIGDVILDHYVLGNVDRISPEAPIPILNVREESFILGGAANVAANLTALGGRAILVGSIGDDIAGSIVMQKLAHHHIDRSFILKLSRHPTVQKTRVVAQGQQLVRIDRETQISLSDSQESSLITAVTMHIPSWDSIVLSDYGKGFVTKRLAGAVINLARKHRKPVIVDPKPQHAHYFKHCTIMTPNQAEAFSMTGRENIQQAGKAIQKKFSCHVLITQGKDGMTLFYGSKIRHIPTIAQEVVDIVGAGDTVAGVLGLALATATSYFDAVRLANVAAGIVVGKHGTATLSPEELIASIP